MPFVGLEAPAGHHAGQIGRTRRQRAKARQVDAVVVHHHARRRGRPTQRAQEVGVDARAGDGELGLAHLHAEQPRHQVDVVGVRAEAERNVEQPVHEQRHGGGVARPVRVQAIDAARAQVAAEPHRAGNQPQRLEQIEPGTAVHVAAHEFQRRQLAVRRRVADTRALPFPARGAIPPPAAHQRRAGAQIATGGAQQHRQVGRQHSRREGRRQIGHLALQGGALRLLSAGERRLDRVEGDVDAAPAQREHLPEDERLVQVREGGKEKCDRPRAAHGALLVWRSAPAARNRSVNSGTSSA